MEFRLAISCFSSLLLASSSCLAATVEPIQGNLYISTGQGFQPVNGRIDTNVGDTVMVAPGGTAVAVYPTAVKSPFSQETSPPLANRRPARIRFLQTALSLRIPPPTTLLWRGALQAQY
jgi:hypothetical protein